MYQTWSTDIRVLLLAELELFGFLLRKVLAVVPGLHPWDDEDFLC